MSTHRKHTHFPLFVSVLNVSVALFVYVVPGKSAALHVASALSAYCLVEIFVSVIFAATVSLVTGHVTTSSVIEIDGFVISMLRGLAEI